MTPFITVVMPVRNEARFIAATLGQILAQDYPKDRFEILVADGMSDDGTREIVRELAASHPQLQLLDNPKRMSSAGRNVGFRQGRGDYFLVVDGHCHLPDRQLFQKLVDCFARSQADCLGRPQPLDPPGLTSFQRAVAYTRASLLGHGGDSLIYGDFEGVASPVSNGAVYSRRVFETIGYVDESFDAAEDVEFNYRVQQAGLICYSSHQLTVKYYPRESLGALFRQMARYGAGRRQFLQKHAAALTVGQLVPALFCAGLVLVAVVGGAAALLPLPGALVLLVAAPYLVYLAAVLAESVRATVRAGLFIGALFPVILVTIHVGLGAGFLLGRRW